MPTAAIPFHRINTRPSSRRRPSEGPCGGTVTTTFTRSASRFSEGGGIPGTRQMNNNCLTRDSIGTLVSRVPLSSHEVGADEYLWNPSTYTDKENYGVRHTGDCETNTVHFPSVTKAVDFPSHNHSHPHYSHPDGEVPCEDPLTQFNALLVQNLAALSAEVQKLNARIGALEIIIKETSSIATESNERVARFGGDYRLPESDTQMFHAYRNVVSEEVKEALDERLDCTALAAEVSRLSLYPLERLLAQELHSFQNQVLRKLETLPLIFSPTSMSRRVDASILTRDQDCLGNQEHNNPDDIVTVMMTNTEFGPNVNRDTYGHRDELDDSVRNMGESQLSTCDLLPTKVIHVPRNDGVEVSSHEFLQDSIKQSIDHSPIDDQNRNEKQCGEPPSVTQIPDNELRGRECSDAYTDKNSVTYISELPATIRGCLTSESISGNGDSLAMGRHGCSMDMHTLLTHDMTQSMERKLSASFFSETPAGRTNMWRASGMGGGAYLNDSLALSENGTELNTSVQCFATPFTSMPGRGTRAVRREMKPDEEKDGTITNEKYIEGDDVTNEPDKTRCADQQNNSRKRKMVTSH